MKRGLRKTLKISAIGLSVIVLVLLAAALVLVLDKPLVRGLIVRQLNKGAGTTVRLGRLDYTIVPFRVSVDSLDLGQENAFQKLGVSLPHFEGRGSLWRLVRGAKPAFDVLEAEGVSLRLEQKAVSETPLDLEKVLLQVSDTLAWARRISLKKTDLSIGLLSGRAEIGDLDLTLTPGPARDVIAYEIGGGSLALKDKTGSPVLAASLASVGRLGLASPFAIDGSLEFHKARFALAGVESSLETISLAATGQFDKPAQELTVSHLKLDAPGLLDFEGRALARMGHGLFIQAEGEARLDDLSTAAGLLRPFLPAEYRHAARRGKVGISGKYMLQRSNTETKDSLTATVTLDGLDLYPPVAGRPLQVHASGRVETAGPTNDPRLNADIRMSLGPVAAPGLTVAATDLHLVGSGSRSGAEIPLLEARLSRLAFEAAPDQRIGFEKAALTVKGHLDLAGQQADLT